MYTAQLKVFYEEQHPETKAGKAGGLGKARKSAVPNWNCTGIYQSACHAHGAIAERGRAGRGRSEDAWRREPKGSHLADRACARAD
jgi:hypothetical protein